ncbi:hypothetical protein R3P38DRAFT_3596107 [Favolaschia claudopus]|uniref:Glycosyltransferase n=1 Tax=Favolaschia claudopus TaxID=2862362 RepID=A0AAW0DNM9_9AGAR
MSKSSTMSGKSSPHAPSPSSPPLRVAIITENFLPKIDGSTITLSHLLHHLSSLSIPTLLLGPPTGMRTYANATLLPAPGVPLPAYPGLRINFLSPAALAQLRAFRPTVVHVVDPVWLGVQALLALRLLFSYDGNNEVKIVTSHHTNLPTYAEVWGYPYWGERMWGVQGWMHGALAERVLVPSASTGALLVGERGWGECGVRVRVVGRGVDCGVFRPNTRSPTLRAQWGAADDDVVILSVGRLSKEKNLDLLIHAYAALTASLLASSSSSHLSPSNSSSPQSQDEVLHRTRPPNTHLILIGDGPHRGPLQALCASLGVHAIFMGQLTGERLGEAVGSADLFCSPSITETFGQVTLQGMAAGLPVVGMYAEGTADLVRHWDGGVDVSDGKDGRKGRRGCGLLLDPLVRYPSSATASSSHASTSTSTSAVEDTAKPPTHAAGLGLRILEMEGMYAAGKKEEEDIPIPDSAVCFEPFDPVPVMSEREREGEMEMEMPELELPSPSLFLPVSAAAAAGSQTHAALEDESDDDGEDGEDGDEDDDDFFRVPTTMMISAASSATSLASADVDVQCSSAALAGSLGRHASPSISTSTSTSTSPSSSSQAPPHPRSYRALAPLLRVDSPEFAEIVEAYAGLMRVLVTNPGLRTTLGQRAYERSKRFTWEACSQRMVDVYAEVVAEGAQASSSIVVGASTSMAAGKTKAETQTPRGIFSGGKRKNGKKALGDAEAQIVGGGVREEVGDGGGDDKVQREEEEEGDGGGESVSLLDKSALLPSATSSSPTFPAPASAIAALGANVREWTTYLLDVIVVVHAVVGATLSHVAFMVPTGDDLAGLMWGSRRRIS